MLLGPFYYVLNLYSKLPGNRATASVSWSMKYLPLIHDEVRHLYRV